MMRPGTDSPRKMKNNAGWHWLKGGKAQGPLIRWQSPHPADIEWYSILAFISR